jgi:hypothetical protein
LEVSHGVDSYTDRRGDLLYKKVLLAYDGSIEGRRALREGARIAQLCGAEVFLLAVAEGPAATVGMQGNMDRREYVREWPRKHPGRYKPRQQRTDLLRLYGPAADYEKMLAAQRGVCGLCGKPPKNERRLAVDHCHRTGQIRGLLCAPCNRALGQLGDDVAGLGRALRYVASSRFFAGLTGHRVESRRVAEEAIATNPHRSDREIAREIGVDPATVGAARARSLSRLTNRQKRVMRARQAGGSPKAGTEEFAPA